MSYAVWKFRIEGEHTVIEIPEPAEFLAFRAQGEECFVWFGVDPEGARGPFFFCALMTGERVKKKPGPYLGTAETAFGIVVHLFEDQAALEAYNRRFLDSEEGR